MRFNAFQVSIATILLAGVSVTAVYAQEMTSEESIFTSERMKIKIGTGFDYSSGKYGADQTTEVLYVPLTAKIQMGGWTGKLTVPWLKIKGPGSVVGAGDSGVIQAGTGVITTESGLGDVVAAVGYTFALDDTTDLDVTGKIKFATADEDRGLGTGVNDYGLNVDINKQLGSFSLFGGAGYKIVGANDQFELDNVWSANAGFGYRVNDYVTAGMTYDWRQSASRSVNPSEATLYMNVKATDRLNVQIYGVAGFSDGSPSHGGGLMLGYKF